MGEHAAARTATESPDNTLDRRRRAASAGSIPTDLGAPLRVLLVDDDDAVRGVVRRLLERLGHEVACCASAAEAAGRDSATLFEVALIDFNLGSHEGEGWELLQALRGRRPDALFVLTSGARPTIPSADDGGPLFLEKPFSKGDLVALLDEARRRLTD